MNHGTQMTQKDTDLHRLIMAALCLHRKNKICVNLCPSVSSVCYKKTTMNHLISLLHEGGFSCVIANQGETRTFTQRGVADLYTLYNNDPAFMQGAVIADKVVGKGAAALMILGGMAEVYTDVVSTPARRLFEQYGVKLSFDKEVPHIINRQQTGYCPLETACGEETDLQRLYRIIADFVTNS